MARVDKDVHCALVVVDKVMGRLLNYLQLLQHPDYQETWTKSSANEFSRLANGVGEHVKNNKKMIKFIPKKDIPQDRMKDITYGKFLCTV